MESHFEEHCKLKVRIADSRFQIQIPDSDSRFRFQISRVLLCDLQSAICDLQF